MEKLLKRDIKITSIFLIYKIHQNKHANFWKVAYIEMTSIFRSWKLPPAMYVKTISGFRSSKFPWKKYIKVTTIFRQLKLHRKSTSKWRGILSIFYFRCIGVISTSSQRQFDLLFPLGLHVIMKSSPRTNTLSLTANTKIIYKLW